MEDFRSDEQREVWERLVQSIEAKRGDKLSQEEKQHLWDKLERTRGDTQDIAAVFGHDEKLFRQTLATVPYFSEGIQRLLEGVSEASGIGDDLSTRAVVLGWFAAGMILFRGAKIPLELLVESAASATTLVVGFENSMGKGDIDPWNLEKSLGGKESSDDPFKDLF